MSSRDQLLADLRGQQVRIPDLEALFEGWPNPINPNKNAVVDIVQHVLETHSMTKAVEMKLKRANLALLIASWYPFASALRLGEITYFVCWMYVIDDAIIDKVSWPGLDNAAAFNAAYEETMAFVRKSLQLDGGDQGQPASAVAAIDSFRSVGETMCQNYSLVQRQTFYNACKLTMDGYRTEQQIRVSGQMPTWDEYWSYREGSSCISMCVAMIEYAMESDIPESIIRRHEMQQLCTETVVICWLTNDIVSAKKELGEGFIENAVALGALDTRKAQIGMDRTVRLVQGAITRFNYNAELVEKIFCSPGKFDEGSLNCREDIHLSQQVSDFVKSCKCLVTGSLSWRYVSALERQITTH